MASRKDFPQTLSERGIQESAYRMLVDHGRRMGRLSRDEVVDIIPDAEFDGPLIEAFVQAISSEGIVVEDETAAVADPAKRVAALYDDNEGVEDAGGEAPEVDDDATSADVETNNQEIDLRGVDVDDVLRMYLREAVQTPLLSQSEEVELARRIILCRMAYEELSRGNTPERRQ